MDIMRMPPLQYWKSGIPDTQLCACSSLVQNTPMTPLAQNFTSFPSFPGGPASPSEQFVAAESQGSNASNWAAFDQEPVHMEEAAAEASAFTDDLQYSTPNSYLLSHVRPPPRWAYRLTKELVGLGYPARSPLQHADRRNGLSQNGSRIYLRPVCHATCVNITPSQRYPSR